MSRVLSPPPLATSSFIGDLRAFDRISSVAERRIGTYSAASGVGSGSGAGAGAGAGNEVSLECSLLLSHGFRTLIAQADWSRWARNFAAVTAHASRLYQLE